MKKFLIVLLGVISIACAVCAFVGCGAPAYYKLTYNEIEGVTFDFNGIENGADVKDGYTVVFTAELSDQLAGKDEAQVKVNGQTLTKNSDGTYSFVMKADSTVTVEGVSMPGTYTVSFVKLTVTEDTVIENRVHYYDLEGNELEEVKLETGEEIKFSIDFSVYYDLERQNPFTVLANDMVLTGEETGGKTIYTLSPIRDTNITVTGLQLKESFAGRNNGESDGQGTFEDPYHIREAIDLYLFADIVNNDFHNGNYSRMYYSLENDIDMKGEQLYIIGDGTTEISYFSGTFLGNGHKISNFVIKDTIIEQSGFTNVFMPYLGLFGKTMPNIEYTKTGKMIIHPCVISDLTLENYTMVIDAASQRSTFYAGGLVGFAMGTEISNCNASGKMTIYADSSVGGYAGGLVGHDQSYYDSQGRLCLSSIASSTSNVTIDGRTGIIVGAGGIVGEMSGMEDIATAYVLNCSATGSINGAVYAGGIAGVVGNYTSVQNCYCAASSVSAYNRNGIVGGSDTAAHAYAGGIAGYLVNDSIIKDCFSVANVTAYATAGTRYAHANNVVGETVGANDARVESVAGVALNNYSANSDVNFNDAQAVKNSLGWSEGDWTFGGTYPAVKQNASAAKTVTLTIYSDNKGYIYHLNKYQPITQWYVSNDVPEFLTENNSISYGYFIKDGENYYKAPAAYVPTGEDTLYAEFADYSEVAGVYYVKTSDAGSGIYIELFEDGTLHYQNGAAQHDSYYTYDGENVLLFDCPLFLTQVTSTDVNNNTVVTFVMFTGKGAIDGNLIKIYDNQNYTQNSTLDGVKKIEGLTYGKYYSAGNDLVLNSDGTAVYNGNSVTYTYDGSGLTIGGTAATFGENTVTVNGTVYTAYDELTGVWEAQASEHELYEFDGKNGWKFTSFIYEKTDGTNTVKEVTTNSGTYSISGGLVTLYGAGNAVYGSAQFDENGFLQITVNSAQKTFYRENSNVGEWKLFYDESVTLKFGGIGKDGVGIVNVNSTYLSQATDFKYDIVEENGNKYVRIFIESDMYAYLGFDLEKLTLSGELYSFKDGSVLNNAAFCLYDNFRGEWLSNKFGVVNFNGLGAYALTGSQATGIAVNGTVTILSTGVAYSVDGSGLNGSFTYKGITYSIVYSLANDTVTVTGDGETFVMHRYDGWRKVKLSDDAGNVYTFNGFGSLEDGGTATVTNGDTQMQYTYKTSADGNTVTLTTNGGAMFCTIVKGASGYVLKKSGSPDATLKIVNVFTGSWTIGVLGGSISVGEVASNYTASGTYCGENVTFVYDFESETMSFEYGGKPLYLVKLGIVTGKEQELALCEVPNTRYGFTRCLKSSIELDSFKGEYESADGSRLVLDGFTVSSVGLGKATYVAANGDSREYDYEANSFGMVVLKTQGVVKYVLNPLEEEHEGALGLGGKWYSLVKPDWFYSYTAVDKEDESVTYSFNGVGQIICSDGTVYSYTQMPEEDTEKLIYVFKLTDAQGNSYTAEMSYGTSDHPIEIKKDN